MKKKYRYLSIWVLMISVTCMIKAQKAIETPAAMFLEVQTDARSAALGGISNISQPSAFGIFNNASANLFSTEKSGIATSASARKDFSESNLFSVGSFYNLNENNGLSFGVRYFGYSGIDIWNEDGSAGGSYTPKEISVDLAYARKLNEHLSASTTLRYVHSDMGTFLGASKASAFAADLGITYASSMESFDGGNWSLALTASNFGTKIKYLDKKIDMPASVKLGTSIHLPFNENHKLTTVVNLGYRVMPSYFGGYEAGIGAEYNLYHHGFLRTGYHISEADKGLGDFATIGAGVQFKPVKLDISYWAGAPDQNLKNILFISLGACF